MLAMSSISYSCPLHRTVSLCISLCVFSFWWVISYAWEAACDMQEVWDLWLIILHHSGKEGGSLTRHLFYLVFHLVMQFSTYIVPLKAFFFYSGIWGWKITCQEFQSLIRASDIHAVCMPFNLWVFKAHKEIIFLAETEKMLWPQTTAVSGTKDWVS